MVPETLVKHVNNTLYGVDREKFHRLVILTTHFGNNFSGGSTATHEIFRRLESYFSEIIVICNCVGEHAFQNIKIKLYRSPFHALAILDSINDHNTIYYGDFYNSIWYVLKKKPFHFTYHDNWPETGSVSIYDRIKSIWYNPLYKLIFKKAETVITVSEYKKQYIKKYAKKVHLIRNGVNNSNNKSSVRTKEKKDHIIMVGNVDRRKYKQAVRLFRLMKGQFKGEIHIYGNIIDKHLGNSLRSFDFIKLKGFKKRIPYNRYTVLLHTAMIENLPIAICEALNNKLPVLAFDVGGINEVVSDENGKLVKPWDFTEMIFFIQKIINKKLSFSFDENKMDEYDWEIASEKYYRLVTP